jgi:hypothetical protein
MKSQGFRVVTIGLKGLAESTQAQGSLAKAHIADEMLRLIEVETSPQLARGYSRGMRT